MSRRLKYKAFADVDLMKAILEKDELAFSELYDRYSEMMLNYFYRMLWKNREKAEDFMHDLFSKIIQKPEQFDTSRNFKTYLFSIANNMCKNEYRKQEVRGRAKNELEYFSGHHTDKPQLDKGTFKNALQEELEQMDEIKRSIFILRFKHELSIKEIGDIMECSEGTVKSRIFYTLKHLNERLKAYEHLVSLLGAVILIINEL